MNRKQRGVLGDALLGAGATLILLYSTTAAARGYVALGAGIILVVAGIVLLWGVPRPDLRTRLLSSTAGLFVGFGLATLGTGVGSYLALAAGVALLLGVWRAVRHDVVRRR